MTGLYRLATRAHALLPYYLSKDGFAFPPWHYGLEVTRRCNLRCSMCQNIRWLKETPVPGQKEGELSTEEWFRVIDQIPRLALITFTGGEPFLRDDFLTLLDRASRRCRTHIITNGTLVTEEVAARCVGLAPKRLGGRGLNVVGVSLHGPAETHDHICGPGAFGKAIEAARNIVGGARLAGKSAPKLHITSVIQAENVGVLHEMPQVAAQAGADILNLTMQIPTLDIKAIREEKDHKCAHDDIPFPRIEAGSLSGALARTRQAANEAGIELRLPDMPEEDILAYYEGAMDLRRFRCLGIWSKLGIDAYGDAAPWCWLCSIGNVRHKSLKELHNSPEVRAFRRRIRQGLAPDCAGCCMLAWCGRVPQARRAER